MIETICAVLLIVWTIIGCGVTTGLIGMTVYLLLRKIWEKVT